MRPQGQSQHGPRTARLHESLLHHSSCSSAPLESNCPRFHLRFVTVKGATNMTGLSGRVGEGDSNIFTAEVPRISQMGESRRHFHGGLCRAPRCPAPRSVSEGCLTRGRSPQSAVDRVRADGAIALPSSRLPSMGPRAVPSARNTGNRARTSRRFQAGDPGGRRDYAATATRRRRDGDDATAEAHSDSAAVVSNSIVQAQLRRLA